MIFEQKNHDLFDKKLSNQNVLRHFAPLSHENKSNFQRNGVCFTVAANLLWQCCEGLYIGKNQESEGFIWGALYFGGDMLGVIEGAVFFLFDRQSILLEGILQLRQVPIDMAPIFFISSPAHRGGGVRRSLRPPPRGLRPTMIDCTAKVPIP